MGVNILLTALGMGLLWGVMAIGVFVTYRILNYADLTAEGSFTLGAALAARLITSGWDPLTSTLFAIVVGMAAGLMTGFFHTVLRVPPLLSGILSMTALYSINLRVMNNRANIPITRGTETLMSRMADLLGTDERSALIAVGCIFTVIFLNITRVYLNLYRKKNTWTYRVTERFGEKQKLVASVAYVAALIIWVVSFNVIIRSGVIMAQLAVWFPASERVAAIYVGFAFVIVVIVLLKLFFNTEIGYVLRATGDNENMAKAQGVNTNRMKILGLVLGNACVALSGALVFQMQGFADIGMGVGTIVIGLASVIIGEVIFSDKGSHRVFNAVVLGSVLYRIIIALVLSLGIHPNDFRLISAIMLALVLSLPLFREKFNFNLKKLVLGRE